MSGFQRLFNTLIAFILCASPASVYAQVDAQTLLNWNLQQVMENDPGKREPAKTPDVPIPPVKPPIPDNFKDKAKKISVTGRDGPRMPAVPAGEVQAERIDPITSGSQDIAKITSGKLSADASPKIQPAKISLTIPYMTFIYSTAGQTDLDPAQIGLFSGELANLKASQYNGQVRVLAYIDKNKIKEKSTRDMITKRASKIRSFLLKQGIRPQQLDIRSVPKSDKDNRVDIFLTGRS